MANYIPKGYHTATPYLICDGAADAIEFYKKAFGATEVMRMPNENGRLAHAEIRIGDSHLMLSDEHPQMSVYGPKHYGGSPTTVLLYMKDVDSVVKGAVALGAKLVRPPEDQFYGDRVSTIKDPFGHQWYVHTHVKDMTPDEMMAAAPR